MNNPWQIEPWKTERGMGGEIKPVAESFVKDIHHRHVVGTRHESFAQLVANKYLTRLFPGITGPSLVFRRQGVLWGDQEGEQENIHSRRSLSYKYYGQLGKESSLTSEFLGIPRDLINVGGREAAMPEIVAKPSRNSLFRRAAAFSLPAIQRKGTARGEAPRLAYASEESVEGQSGISGKSNFTIPEQWTAGADSVRAKRTASAIGFLYPQISHWGGYESTIGSKMATLQRKNLSLANVDVDAPLIHIPWTEPTGWGSENNKNEAGSEWRFPPGQHRQKTMRPLQAFVRVGGLSGASTLLFHGYEDSIPIGIQERPLTAEGAFVQRHRRGGRWTDSAKHGGRQRVQGVMPGPSLMTSRPLVQRRALSGIEFPASKASKSAGGQSGRTAPVGERMQRTDSAMQGRERRVSEAMPGPSLMTSRPLVQRRALSSAALPIFTSIGGRAAEGVPFGASGDGAGLTAHSSLPTSGSVGAKDWQPAGASGESNTGLHALHLRMPGEGLVISSDTGKAEGINTVLRELPILAGAPSIFKTVSARHQLPQRKILGDMTKLSARVTGWDGRWMRLGTNGRRQSDERAIPAQTRMLGITSPLLTSRFSSSHRDEASAEIDNSASFKTRDLPGLENRGVKRADLILGGTAASSEGSASREAGRGNLPLAPTAMLFHIPPALDQPALPMELLRNEIQSQMRGIAASSKTSEIKTMKQQELSVSSVADQVYHLLERRLIVERERRGIF